jgi:peptide/nickel transport system permease protein
LVLFLLRRIARAALVVWAAVTIVFLLTRVGGDPAALLMPEGGTAEERERLRARWGLDRPVVEQYFVYLARAAQGDFGRSIRTQEPALSLVMERLPATGTLVALAACWSLAISLPLGVVSAMRRGSGPDLIVRLVSGVGEAVPAFLLGILFILLFSVVLGWLPAAGSGSWRHLVLPTISLTTYLTPVTLRVLRANILEVLQQDYVRTARAKGLTERAVLYRHVLRSSLIPASTIFALRLSALLGGAVITEQVFGYPGMGRLAIQSIAYRDYPVVQAFVAVTAAMVAGTNIALDLLYGWLDPRVRS